MGKNKRTRWRTFELEPAQTLNSDKVDAQKGISRGYSRNQEPHAIKFGKRNYSTSDEAGLRQKIGKENTINQHHGVYRNWQRNSYRPLSSDISTAEEDSRKKPVTFNEDEFVRISTPRSDLLFRKCTKIVANNNQLSESTIESQNGANEPATVNTCSTSSSPSPATSTGYTHDYGLSPTQSSPMQYVYYEDNGMFVIPMYNGYNFYPSDGSPATPPFFLMPYQFDPLFMPCELADNAELDKAIGKIENSEMEEDHKHEEDSSKIPTDYQSERNYRSNFNNCIDEVETTRIRRRKRLLHARNSQMTQSTDTTSDDDNISSSHSNKVWQAYSTSEQQHYFNKHKQDPKEVHLNVEVKEFQPRRLESIPGEKASIPIEINGANAAALEGNMEKQETKQKDLTATKTSRNNVSSCNTYTRVVTEDVEEINSKPSGLVDDKKSMKTANEPKKKGNGACSVKNNASKSRNSKIKSKRRKSLLGRQDGFEIIEPDFTKKSAGKLSDSKSTVPNNIGYESDCYDTHFVNTETSGCIHLSEGESLPKPTTNIENEMFLDKPGKVVLDKCQVSSNHRYNIAELEREVVENLRLFDEDIDFKSPIINRLIDFPITLAVANWMQTVDSVELWDIERFSNLSHVFKYEDEDNTDDTSEISDFHPKSETDSDYLSDFQTKNNSPTNHLQKQTIECNIRNDTPQKLKSESFCALM